VGLGFRRWAAAIAGLTAIPGLSAASPEWRLARSDHFEVYCQTNDQEARAILGWFEQLRAFFEQQGGWRRERSGTGKATVRVIVFASEQEYQPYRPRATSDAYYATTGSLNYIVMGASDPGKFALAAHEYAHLALNASGLELPLWLNEGMAEFFATLRIKEHSTELGGTIESRIHALQRRSWIPLRDLLVLTKETQRSEDRAQADVFYSESWALAEMLMLGPDYAAGFPRFIARMSARMAGAEAFALVYGKTLDALTRDLGRWVNRANLPTIELPPAPAAALSMDVSGVPTAASRMVLAELLLASGEFERAETSLNALARDEPDTAEVFVTLGTIALHKGDAESARKAWKRAMDLGISDPNLCYQYAILADNAGLAPAEIRAALERTVALDPGFDDARYKLALIEKGEGHYEAAVRDLKAMRAVSDARAFAYWLALADSFNELDRRDAALDAARQAREHAATATERRRADEQAYIAQTDLGVQFSRDASGRAQISTTRTPHAETDWNPFIEATDDIHRVQGTLREIDCGAVTTIRIAAAGKSFKLAIPDLGHVQMRHAPADFVCGPQPMPARVTVDYAPMPGGATDGIVRGMNFE
jgi:tetratricopeptide (TPR) repeat protein